MPREDLVVTPNPANSGPLAVTATVTEGGNPKTVISAAEFFIDTNPPDTVRGTAMAAAQGL